MKLSSLGRLEFLKLKAGYNYTLLFIFALLILLVTTMLFYVQISTNGVEGGASLPLEGQLDSIYLRLGQLGSIVIALLTILNIGAEYKNESFKRNIMDGLTRNQLFLSKILGIGMLILFTIFSMLVLIILTGAGMKGIAFNELIANLISADLFVLLTRLLFAAGFALFFIVIFRTSSFAIIAVIGYLFFEVIVGLIEKLRFQTDYAEYLPHNYVTNMIGLPELTVLQAISLGVVILAFYLLSWLIFIRRDL